MMYHAFCFRIWYLVFALHEVGRKRLRKQPDSCGTGTGVPNTRGFRAVGWRYSCLWGRSILLTEASTGRRAGATQTKR